MTLRGRLSILLVFVLLLVSAATALLFRFLFLDTFARLERDQLGGAAEAVRSVAMNRIGRMTSSSIELAVSEEMAGFVDTRNLDLLRAVVSEEFLAERGVEALAVFGADGRLLFSTGFDPAGGGLVQFPPGLQAVLQESGLASPTVEGMSGGGIVFVGTSAWMVGAADVEAVAPPSGDAGTVLSARRIDRTLLEDLVCLPGTTVRLLPPGSGPAGLSAAPGRTEVRPLPGDTVEVYALLGEGPGLDPVLRITGPRQIYSSGRGVAGEVVLLVLGACLLFTLVTMILFELVVMGPLKDLSGRIRMIGESGDPSRRCGKGGGDELARLAGTVDETLEKLQRASSDLRQTRMRFEQFSRFMPGYAFIKHPDGRLLYASESFRREVLGAREDWEGLQESEIWPPEVASRIRDLDRQVLSTGRPTVAELDAQLGVPGIRSLLFHIFPVGPDESGVSLIGGITIDMTGRKRAEEELGRLQKRNAAILDAIPESVFVLSRDGTIVGFHAGTEARLSVPEDQVVDTNLTAVGMAPEDLVTAMETVIRVLNTKQAEVFEYRIVEGPAQGIFECRMGPFETGTVVCTVREVTGRKRLEAELLAAQKQESMSLMAGGIAHDFRNILSAVSGNIDLGMASGDPAKVERHLQNALEACDKASLLLKQLETLARGESPGGRTRLDLAGLLSGTARLVLSGSGIRFEMDAQSNLWRVLANEGQMVQAFSNFIVNAREAMQPGGGVITARLWNRMSATGEREVATSISDTGPGIPRDVLARIFDPYFTTKERGSGLGLAVTLSLVTQHGGRIEVDSTPGSGTTFTITLPAA